MDVFILKVRSLESIDDELSDHAVKRCVVTSPSSQVFSHQNAAPQDLVVQPRSFPLVILLGQKSPGQIQTNVMVFLQVLSRPRVCLMG